MRVAELHRRTKQQHKVNPVSQPLAKVPGYRPVGALSLALTVDPGRLAAHTGEPTSAQRAKDLNTGIRLRAWTHALLADVDDALVDRGDWNFDAGLRQCTIQRPAASSR